jgi:hypothetical protein
MFGTVMFILFVEVGQVGWSMIRYLLDMGKWAKNFSVKTVDEKGDGLDV